MFIFKLTIYKSELVVKTDIHFYSLVALKKRNSKASADSIDDFDSRELAGSCKLYVFKLK